MPRSSNLYVFAHQDDEVFALPVISRQIQSGEDVYCIFLTDGEGRDTPFARRRAESLMALGWIGVPPDHIFFLADTSRIADLRLVEFLDDGFVYVLNAAQRVIPDKIFVLAAEGGHPDHDCVVAIALKVSRYLGFDVVVREIAAYRAGPFFWPVRVASISRVRGLDGEVRLGPKDFIMILRGIMYFPSQWRTWSVLGPLLLLSLASHRRISFTAALESVLVSPPPTKKFLYERFFKVSRLLVHKKIVRFIAS